MTTKLPSTRSLATAAAACLLFFPLAVLTLQVVQSRNYSPTAQAMSELALGQDGWLMTIAFSAMGAGSILLALTLRAQFPRAWVAPICLILAGCFDMTSAIFQTNGGGPDTTSSTIHMIAGLSTFTLSVVAMFTCVRTFRRDARWASFAWVTLAWALVAVGAFFLVPVLGDDRFGLAQRIFVATWLSWMIVVAIRSRLLSPALIEADRRVDVVRSQH